MSETLHDMFLDELRDAYDAEQQITKALPKMIKAVTSTTLQRGLEAHLKETEGQIGRLEKAFSLLEEKVKGKHCDGMEGILQEGSAVLEEDLDGVTLDACIIASAQRVEHYEMAAYGTLVAWARAMEHEEVADLLQQTLDEEKAADETLTAAAEGGINDEAAELAHSGDETDADTDDEPATVGTAAKKRN
jgi:ferritin-like metal-binding protein YciE